MELRARSLRVLRTLVRMPEGIPSKHTNGEGRHLSSPSSEDGAAAMSFQEPWALCSYLSSICQSRGPSGWLSEQGRDMGKNIIFLPFLYLQLLQNKTSCTMPHPEQGPSIIRTLY